MTQWIRTYAPIVEVLKHSGFIGINDLQRKLIEIEPMKFRGDRMINHIVEDLTACLVIEGNRVVYDKSARKYAQLALFERSIQKALHDTLPTMNEWQLYPHLTTKNSERCYLGVSWKEVPTPNDCDFRCEGEDSCHLGCAVKKDVLKKYGF